MKHYSMKLYKDIARATELSPDSLGVELGCVCADAHIPVQIVASWLCTTRAGVYLWFTGIHDITPRKRNRAVKIIKTLLAGLDAGKLPAADMKSTIEIMNQYKGD